MNQNEINESEAVYQLLKSGVKLFLTLTNY